MATVRAVRLAASAGPTPTMTLVVKLDGIRVGENGIERRWLVSRCPQSSIPLYMYLSKWCTIRSERAKQIPATRRAISGLLGVIGKRMGAPTQIPPKRHRVRIRYSLWVSRRRILLGISTLLVGPNDGLTVGRIGPMVAMDVLRRIDLTAVSGMVRRF